MDAYEPAQIAHIDAVQLDARDGIEALIAVYKATEAKWGPEGAYVHVGNVISDAPEETTREFAYAIKLLCDRESTARRLLLEAAATWEQYAVESAALDGNTWHHGYAEGRKLAAEDLRHILNTHLNP